MKRLFYLLDQVKWFGLRKVIWIFKDFFSDLDPDNQQSLIKRGLGRKLIRYYFGEGHGLEKKQYFLGFGLIHYTIIRNTRPKHVLCIGSQKGFIPAILALACKDNRFGHVDFVDANLDVDDPDHRWGGIGFWTRNNPKKHFSRLGVEPYLSTYLMTSKEFSKKYRKRYQYIYIDADHSYQGVKNDYLSFWPRLEKGGFMVFHDISAHGIADKAVFGVWKFWREIGKVHAISFSLYNGLGILQK